MAVAGGVALVDEPFAQAARQFGRWLLGKVTVIGVGFAGQQDVQDVVEVIVPLRVEVVPEQAGLVEFVFQHQPHMPAGVDLLTYPVSQFLQETGVVDGVHRVQAQAVEAVLQQPHQRVIEKEIPHFTAIEVDAGAPGVCASSRKKPLAYWPR
jgi:hypothetical protein